MNLVHITFAFFCTRWGLGERDATQLKKFPCVGLNF